jgi:hypothetical protein
MSDFKLGENGKEKLSESMGGNVDCLLLLFYWIEGDNCSHERTKTRLETRVEY